MISELKIYLACFVGFVVIDFVWIGLVMKNFYIRHLQPIGRISGDKFEPIIWAACVVYVALAIGIVQFALPKINSETSWLATFGIGFLLGLVVYATYDFTNYSTLKDFTLTMAVVDSIWGGTVTGLVTLIARYVRG